MINNSGEQQQQQEYNIDLVIPEMVSIVNDENHKNIDAACAKLTEYCEKIDQNNLKLLENLEPLKEFLGVEKFNLHQELKDSKGSESKSMTITERKTELPKVTKRIRKPSSKNLVFDSKSPKKSNSGNKKLKLDSNLQDMEKIQSNSDACEKADSTQFEDVFRTYNLSNLNENTQNFSSKNSKNSQKSSVPSAKNKPNINVENPQLDKKSVNQNPEIQNSNSTQQIPTCGKIPLTTNQNLCRNLGSNSMKLPFLFEIYVYCSHNQIATCLPDDYVLTLWYHQPYLTKQSFLIGSTYLNAQRPIDLKTSLTAWLVQFAYKNNVPSSVVNFETINFAIEEWQRRQKIHFQFVNQENLRRQQAIQQHFLRQQQIICNNQNNISTSILNHKGLPTINTNTNTNLGQNNRFQMDQQAPQQNVQQTLVSSKPKSVSPLKIKIPQSNAKK